MGKVYIVRTIGIRFVTREIRPVSLHVINLHEQSLLLISSRNNAIASLFLAAALCDWPMKKIPHHFFTSPNQQELYELANTRAFSPALGAGFMNLLQRALINLFSAIQLKKHRDKLITKVKNINTCTRIKGNNLKSKKYKD